MERGLLGYRSIARSREQRIQWGIPIHLGDNESLCGRFNVERVNIYFFSRLDPLGPVPPSPRERGGRSSRPGHQGKSWSEKPEKKCSVSLYLWLIINRFTVLFLISIRNLKYITRWKKASYQFLPLKCTYGRKIIKKSSVSFNFTRNRICMKWTVHQYYLRTKEMENSLSSHFLIRARPIELPQSFGEKEVNEQRTRKLLSGTQTPDI